MFVGDNTNNGFDYILLIVGENTNKGRAFGLYHFENESQPDKFNSIIESLLWAVTSLATVGYGDSIPITLGGKIFTFIILMIGLGAVSIPDGNICFMSH